MIIGITGKSGVGKTYFAEHMLKGFTIVNIDEIAHKVMYRDDIKEKIEEVFDINLNQVSRKVLGDIIFNSRHEKKKLSDIIWVEMKKEIDTILDRNENVVFDWILLPHSHYFDLCDITILINADEKERFKKVLVRDGITKEYLEVRDKNGIVYDESKFTFVINNTYKGKAYD